MLLIHWIRFIIGLAGLAIVVSLFPLTQAPRMRVELILVVLTIVSLGALQFYFIVRWHAALRRLKRLGWRLKFFDAWFGFFLILHLRIVHYLERVPSKDEFAIVPEYRSDRTDYQNVVACLKLLSSKRRRTKASGGPASRNAGEKGRPR